MAKLSGVELSRAALSHAPLVSSGRPDWLLPDIPVAPHPNLTAADGASDRLSAAPTKQVALAQVGLTVAAVFVIKQLFLHVLQELSLNISYPCLCCVSMGRKHLIGPQVNYSSNHDLMPFRMAQAITWRASPEHVVQRLGLQVTSPAPLSGAAARRLCLCRFSAKMRTNR